MAATALELTSSLRSKFWPCQPSLQELDAAYLKPLFGGREGSRSELMQASGGLMQRGDHMHGVILGRRGWLGGAAC